MAAAVIATALVAGSCFEPGSQPCVDGSVCPKNFKCTATGDACIPAESRCGDGIKDPNEACDDGNVKDGDGCSHDCQSNETCGNGVRDAVVGEVCDDGNTVSGDGCSADCLSKEGCGNGRQDPGEECDDNNLANDDNCPSTCKIAFCGDGFVNDAGHREQCDDMGESVQCNGNCTWSSCGDQVLNRTAGEECDLGPVDTRTCTHLCKASFCGDKYINGDAGEVCDDSTNGQTACPYGTPSCNACNATCTARVNLTGPFCGDHLVEPLPDGGAEACDDSTNGRTVCPYGTPTCTGCSACSAVVNLTGPFCGDLTIEPLPDGGTEFCDDLTRLVTSCAYGTPTCTVCNNTCTGLATRTGPFCGDHTVDPLPDGGVEACDDLTNGRTVCPYGTPTCTGCSACSAVVPLTGPFCGDDVRETQPDGGLEPCDDSSRDAGACAYGTSTCSACSPTCTIRSLTGPFCGDHVVDNLPDGGVEACDDTTTGMTSCAYGTPTCSACKADCSGTQPLTGQFCGDGTRNGPEACDDGNSSSCGTCSASCLQAQAGSAAVGTITTVGPSSIVDGETFTLNDGVNQEVFEFDKGDGGTTGHVVVDISSAGGANGVAGTVNGAINTEQTAGRLTITSSRSSNVLSLTNTQAGSAGNQPITETVANSGFLVSGMSGGRAFDCPAGTGCVGNSDCAPGLTCQPVDGGTGNTCE